MPSGLPTIPPSEAFLDACGQLGLLVIDEVLDGWRAAQHDIVGYNYMIHKAESDHERVSERVMMQTESYPADAWKNYIMAKL